MTQNLRAVMCGTFTLLALTAATQSYAKDIIVKSADWQITYQEQDHTFRFDHLAASRAVRTMVQSSRPEVTYDNAAGVSQTLTSASFGAVTYAKQKVSDAFGRGVCHSFTFSNPDNGEPITLTQHIYLYADHDYLLTDLTLGGSADIQSNYLAPIATTAAYPLFVSSGDNRMLRVPFDNDGFVRYQKYHLEGEMTSYEATVLFEGVSRNGLVIGSVDHDHWKSAIAVNVVDHGTIGSLKAFSGVANSDTRDVLPHGKLVGPTITSARMFVGFFADWRLGMETFGIANTLVQPKRNTWTGGTPFGWQSWGVMAEHNSYDVDAEVSAYFHDVLKPGGFVNAQGLNIISIDAWDNLSHEQKIALNKNCADRGQVAGTYATPFCLWWNDDMLDRKIEDDSQYTGRDCVLKVNGKPYKLDGAFCLDPTHPGVKARISHELQRIKAEGFGYVKVDFTSNGMVQADSYYNPAVKTAVEAYNEGFTHFIHEADAGTPLFVALSIAPIFPYQYGNSRRIACDTWGKIGHSEYCLNSVGGGFWTNRFYQYNDPDHLVLVGNDADKETVGENRARVTSGAISGMLLVSDNYCLNDRSGRGDAKLSRQRAHEVLMNRDVMAIGNGGRSFMPVYGYAEYNGQADGAECCFMQHTADYLYVAVINYQDRPLEGRITLERLGIAPGRFTDVRELWTATAAEVSDWALPYAVPAHDARIYRFTKVHTTAK